ncbi:MAG TPA: hypothetical protein VIK97_17785 [Casimicrobiaceae bacterium]
MRIFQAAFAVGALMLVQSAMAQDFIKGGEDKVTLNLGGILNQFDTTVGINGNAGQGTPINLEGNGLKKSLSSFEASGTWRWAEHHRSDFMYFSANRSGSKQYDRDIIIGDNVFKAGADVNAEAKDEFLLIDYRYSFVKSDALEFAGVLGLYGGKFNFNVNGTVTVAGGEGATASASTSSSTTVPLPLIGASLDWYIQPRWKVTTQLEGMQAKIGNVNGHAVVSALGTDYMLTRNWGLGLAYMYTNVAVDATSSRFNGNLDWKTSAVLAYATLKF